MNKLSILQSFKKENYFSKPIPYIEIDNVLDSQIYNELKKDYKLFTDQFEKEKKYNENNIRMQKSADEILPNAIYKKSIWYDFIQYHTSKEFFFEILNNFEKDLDIFYPEVKKIYKNNLESTNLLNIRSQNNNKKFHFVSDCQPGINSPVHSKSAVRGPHVDNPVELFGGLFYLRDDDDNIPGGDLVIFKKLKKVYFKDKAEVENLDSIEPVKKIKYDKNKLVFFLNSEDSIHSVTPREKTNKNRNLTNFVFERYYDDNKFFKIKRKTNIIKKIFHNIRL